MREFFGSIRKAFRAGLEPEAGLNNADFLFRAHNARASEVGLRPMTPIVSLSPEPPAGPPPETPVPVITVAGAPWFEAYRAAGKYDDWTLRRGMAPFSVFFEGWESTPREEIAEWAWDFGDGSDVKHGFNVGHIYETPGTYTVTLTVTAKDGGFASTTTSVEVLARTGRVFTVDAVSGSDANDGINAPWRTATKAFSGMNTGFYQPGDDIVFARGQTFDLDPGVVNPGHYKAGYGYRFRAADGPGDLPVIQRSGGSGKLIALTGHNHDFITFQDLVFDNVNPASGYDCIEQVGRFQNLTFLRVEIKNAYRSLPCYGYLDDNQSWSGLFVHDCHFHDSGNVHLFLFGRRISVRDSQFVDAGNHCCYGDWEQSASFLDSDFIRPHQGRRCWRLAAETGGFTVTSKNVYVRDCRFEGDLDAVLNRYTLCLAEVAPNTNTQQTIEDVVIENTQFVNGEQLFRTMSSERVEVHHCAFSTVDAYEQSQRIFIGAQSTNGTSYTGGTFEKRPSRDITIRNNTISVNGDLTGSNKTVMFAVNKYLYAVPYGDMTCHHNIRIYDNDCTFVNEWGYAFDILDGSADQMAQIRSANTWTGVDRAVDLAVRRGGYTQTIDAYFAATGNEDPAGWEDETPPVPTLPTADWPFPQLFTTLDGTDLYWYRDAVYSSAGVRLYTPLAPGGAWHFAEYPNLWMAANGAEVTFRLPYSTYGSTVGFGANTVCAAGDSVILGGLSGARLQSEEFLRLFKAWRAHSGGVVNDTMVPDGSWILWWNIGGGAADLPFRAEIAAITGDQFSSYEAVLHDYIRQGRFGFAYAGPGTVLAIHALGTNAVVYGSESVGILDSRYGDDGVTRFSYRKVLDIGIGGRGHVAGDGSEHWFVDTTARVWVFGSDGAQPVGYNAYLGPLVATEDTAPVVGCYDPEEREAYFSNGSVCYVMKQGRLVGSRDDCPTRLVRRGGLLRACTHGAASSAWEFESGRFDCQQRALKTLRLIEVSAQSAANLEMACRFRYTGETAWRDRDWVKANQGSTAYMLITAYEFRIRAKGTWTDDNGRIDYAYYRWTLPGKQHIRGLYGQAG